MSKFKQVFEDYRIHREYQQLREVTKVPNVYLIPSQNSPFIWYGVIFVHTGIYEGGVFRFTIFIPESFSCPKVIFNPMVYHPLISPDTGELDVKQCQWNKNTSHIADILYFVREIFLDISTKSPSNKEAAHLFDTDLDKFKQVVTNCVEDSNRKIYDNPPINADDPNAIKFTKLDSEGVERVKDQMKKFI